MISVMQPYLFPYIGYFQLVMASDIFVLFDDVNYIKKSFINRNSILLNYSAYRFTVPVLNVSQNRKINEHVFSSEIDHFFKILQVAYGKAPFYKNILPILEKTLLSHEKRVSLVCYIAIKEIFEYLGINKKIVFSSDIKYDRNANAEDKIISIIQFFNEKDYVNAIGGKSLYDYGYFKQKNINLNFIMMNEIKYKQGKADIDFLPNLSILDALMWCEPSVVKELLQKYSILSGEYV